MVEIYVTAAVLVLGSGIGGLIITVVNFGVLLHHQVHLSRRLADVKDENSRLRAERMALQQTVADLNLKLEMVIVENAKLASNRTNEN